MASAPGVTPDFSWLSRLHDESGRRIDLPGLRYLPRTVAETVVRKATGYRPPVPWLSYRAIGAIRGLIGASSRVLEFGSGMSTVWFARRCAFVHSIEDDVDWYDMVGRMLRARETSNVRLELRPLDTYSELATEELGTYDFVLVDGAVRTACTETAIRAVRRGGCVYLDNADRDLPDFRDAEAALLRAVEQRGTHARHFVDFCPAHFRATRGLLARL